MKKIKFLSLAFLTSVSIIQAQDISQAKKAIDAEQFENAKVTLKSIVNANPSEGEAFFLLGNVYLFQNIADSAKISYNKGLNAKDNPHFNHIGLGQISLDNGNLAEANAKFELAKKEMRRKDFQEYVYIARAYMNSANPNYKSALAVLELAKEKNGQEPQVLLALGDAYYGDKNQNDAYRCYRDAFQADNSLIRAKMQLGVLLKGAKAYTEAVAAYDDVIATSPNYGPVYRELAETYYLWGNNQPSKYDEYIKKALGYYEKYMSLTDYSLASRMRHADFLILAKDYKALEIEANKMKQLDKVNPRILRYLGYSAYENGNIDSAIQSLNAFINNADNKIIAMDYMYLGLAKMKKASKADDSLDLEVFNEAVGYIKKAVDMEPTLTTEIGDIGKKLYEQKMFKEASAIFEIATSNKESKNYLLDNFYLGNSIYFDNTRSGAVKDTIALKKADIAFGNVIEASPATQDVYVYRARTQSLLDNDELMIKYYQQYIDLVTQKGPEELAKSTVKSKLIEAYNTMAAGYANTDKAKAIEYFNKTLAIDPANAYATQSIKSLK
ncbi:tetratricopeptide repeat protein [Flavobacterium faecale]|uniref:tetratricopeptide repeat protein n=1 Tax=Flavobacterium faecale TaxID=1355330 RepID=UPI003AAFFDAC